MYYVYIISNTLFYWGISDITTYGVSVQAMNWNSVPEKIKKKIDKTTTKIANKISKTKRVKVRIKTKVWFMIMRMMQKNDMGSSKAEKVYWEQNGWFGKERPWK